MPDPIEASFAKAVSLIGRTRKRAHEAIGHELVRGPRLDTCTDTAYGVK